MRNEKKELNLNFQYQAYLKRGGLAEESMGETQRIEIRRAFYGGFGQALISMRDELSEDEDAAVAELETMHDQVLEFFKREAGLL